MKIQTVQNQNFNGWARGAENRLRCYLLREASTCSSMGIEKLFNQIEKNSANILVDFDATFSNPRFMIEVKNNPSKIFVGPDTFHRSIKSCMKKVNAIVLKENKSDDKSILEIISKATDTLISKIKTRKQPKSILDMPFEDLPISPKAKVDGPIPPIKLPNFSNSKSLIQK